MHRPTIGVFPSEALQRVATLWAALAEAFGVTFVAGATSGRGIDAAICHDDCMPTRGDIPVLVLGPGPTRLPVEGSVRLTNDQAVDSRLRDVHLPEQGGAVLPPVAVPPGAAVLAIGPSGPLWSAADNAMRCSAALPVLGDDGPRLKDHLRPRRFLAMVAITHLLRAVTGYAGWTRPAARVSITFDDPNLRGRSYGFLEFRELDEHARRFGYHVDIATVPADAGAANARTAALFRSSQHLSLVAHGNDHVRGELLQHDPDRALAVAAQAIRRIEALEARHRLHVGRVMTPPHGVCSQATMTALRQVGFEAISYRGPDEADALAGWLPADLHFGDRLPGLQRVSLACGSGELAIRAFLDQPVSMVAHHGDLAGGFGVLEQAVDRAGSTRGVAWLSLEDMIRSNFWHRVEGTTMHLRLHTSQAVVAVPQGIDDVVVEAAGDSQARVRPIGAGLVDVSVPPSNPRPAELVSAPPWRPWPRARRVAAEGRDRLLPLVHGVRRRRAG